MTIVQFTCRHTEARSGIACTCRHAQKLGLSFHGWLTCMTNCLHLERASSAFSTGMSLMAASSSFLICLLPGCFSTSSKDPKGTVTEAGRLISFGNLPLSPDSIPIISTSQWPWFEVTAVHKQQVILTQWLAVAEGMSVDIMQDNFAIAWT